MVVFASLITPETLERLWHALHGIDPLVALLVVFGLLFLAGCGLPLPEDIPLTFSGILLGLPPMQHLFGGVIPAAIAVGLVCGTAILGGDLIAYWLGKRYGRTISRYAPFRWAMPEKRIRRLERWFVRFGSWTVFFGRMVAGIRFVTFVMAGMARMPLGRFVLFDALAALVTVPAWIVLGYMLGTHFQHIVEWMSRISTTTWVVLAVLAGLFVLYRVYRARRRRQTNSSPSPAA